jgi:aspartate kinase
MTSLDRRFYSEVMIVMKFGGSSLESADALQRVVSIVEAARHEAPVVVVSAMGKTTDRLLKAGTLAAAGKLSAAHAELYSLESFHTDHLNSSEIATLFANASGLLNRIANACALSPVHSDELLSYGERLSSLVVAHALGAVHLQAEKLIVTDVHHTNAAPLLWETYAKLRRAIPAKQISVLGGFIGSTDAGIPTTLGRGGSDFTASLVGAAINAEEIQIWTDVDGMLSCDPRVAQGGRCLRAISYQEAAEMAEWGAKVLHSATIAPAIRQRVPISIRNSRNQFHPGTLIGLAQPSNKEGLVKSIACLQHADGRAAISLIGQGIEQNPGLVAHAVKTLTARSIRYHSMATATLRVTFLISSSDLNRATECLHDEFVKFQEDGPFYSDYRLRNLRSGRHSKHLGAVRPDQFPKDFRLGQFLQHA